jgi:MFS family permease
MRRVLALTAAIMFVDALLFGALIPLIPDYVERFDLSKAAAGAIFGAFGAGAVLVALPAGYVTGRVGPKRAVVGGLIGLGVASFGFAVADSPELLAATRFLQGAASSFSWAGALAWIAAVFPRNRRGQALGTAFGVAIAGFIVGPLLGAAAHLTSSLTVFGALGVVALALAGVAATRPPEPGERTTPGALGRALSDPAYLTALWLNLLPALFFGVLDILAPLALHDAGYGALAIGAVFFAAGAVEALFHPWYGRLSDRSGRLRPIVAALAVSVGVGVTFAFASDPWLITLLVLAAGVSFGGVYSPAMALVSDRSEVFGLSQGLGFGVSNAAWSAGALIGPLLGGALADATGDAAPYLLCAALSSVTLVVIATRVRGTLETA